MEYTFLMRALASHLVCFLLLAGIAGIAGCASQTVDENDPASLFKDAEDDIKSDHYQLAIDKLRVIRNKFPYSKYSIDAQLRIADVYFLQESYLEAAASYESFRDLHPKHEKVEYAMFRAGKAYQNDIPGAVSRDLTSAYRALDAYSAFLNMFQHSAEAPQAHKNVFDIRNALAEKELYIADFYFIRNQYESAAPRYKKILDSYPDTGAAKLAGETLAKITKATKDRPRE
jgi:outer membrane protein assembly factor BamD